MSAFGTVFKGGWGGVAFVLSVIGVTGVAFLSTCSGTAEGTKKLFETPPEGSTRVDEAKKAFKRETVSTISGGLYDTDKTAEQNAYEIAASGVSSGVAATKKIGSVSAAAIEGAYDRAVIEAKKEAPGVIKRIEEASEAVTSSSRKLITPAPVQVTPANVPAAGVPSHWSKFLRETFPGKCVQGKTAAKSVGYEMSQEDLKVVCPEPK